MTNWNRTQVLEIRLALDEKIKYTEGQPSYMVEYGGEMITLPIIRRDSPIIGGVCLGKNPREAFYVGPNSSALNGLKEEVKERALYQGKIRRGNLLPSIYDTVKERLPYDLAKSDEIISKRVKTKDGLISLGEFIRGHAGVCRHQAVACAALIELLGKDPELRSTNNHLRGKPSVDRNGYPGFGHVWTRYTSYDGAIFILDVAKHFLGTLYSEETQREIEEGTLWPYNRPDEPIPPPPQEKTFFQRLFERCRLKQI